MALRGRGTLEVREDNNPFFQTTSRNIGRDLATRKQFEAPRFARPEPRDANDGFDFSFMYEKSSAKIGQGCAPSDSKLSATLARHDPPGEVAKAKGRGLYPMASDPGATDAALTMAGAGGAVLTTEDVLDAYTHAPKPENSMYTTSNNQFGLKKPTAATFTNERAARSQMFSNSFNGVKPRNQGLNTAITLSVVHTQLDPQWI
jgi:hypothetical protein